MSHAYVCNLMHCTCYTDYFYCKRQNPALKCWAIVSRPLRGLFKPYRTGDGKAAAVNSLPLPAKPPLLFRQYFAEELNRTWIAGLA